MNATRMALGALAFACAATAFAQPGPRERGHGPGPGAHAPRMGPPPGRHMNRPDHRMDRPGPRRGPPVAAYPAYPQYQRFNRGDRLPPQFRRPQYVVNDWRGHGLRQPPRGYYWVQNGSDYVLAAIATGVISAVVINALTN